MSELETMRTKIQGVAASSQTVYSGLNVLSESIAEIVPQVSQAIGGSAAGVDANIISLLQQAQKAVEEAVQALRKAEESASEFANRL